MKKLIFTGLILLTVTLMAFPALAKHNGWSGRGTPEGHRTEHVEQLKLLLDLSPEQTTEIRGIIENHREKSREQRATARRNREEVRKIMESETLDETRLRALLHEQAELKVDKMVSKHALQEDVNQLLTPEQLEKKAALKKIKRHRMRSGGKMSQQAKNN